jgi:hypothetical protein
MNSSDKCRHGYYTDPNGYHIIPKTEKEKSTAELIEEAQKFISEKSP